MYKRQGAEASRSIEIQCFSSQNKENIIAISETVSLQKPTTAIDSVQVNMKLLLKSIHPHELLLQEDLFYSDHTSNTLEFVFQRLLISSSKDNKEFTRNLNLNLKRLYCEHTNPLSNEPFIKIK